MRENPDAGGGRRSDKTAPVLGRPLRTCPGEGQRFAQFGVAGGDRDSSFRREFDGRSASRLDDGVVEERPMGAALEANASDGAGDAGYWRARKESGEEPTAMSVCLRLRA